VSSQTQIVPAYSLSPQQGQLLLPPDDLLAAATIDAFAAAVEAAQVSRGGK
jgi:hypothetical protein